MSALWRLALRGAIWMVVLTALVAAALFVVFDAAYSVSFVYGAGMGILSFVSMAFTVSLLAGRPGVVMAMIGAASFFARLGFAAAVLALPAYLGLWPVVPMICGFAGVYVVENLLLVAMAPKTAKEPGTKREDDPGGAQRKVGI
jgi:hypothetical protein